MSQNCLKFLDKFETKLRTVWRPYRDNFETNLTIILMLRAIWDIFETWVHSDEVISLEKNDTKITDFGSVVCLLA